MKLIKDKQQFQEDAATTLLMAFVIDCLQRCRNYVAISEINEAKETLRSSLIFVEINRTEEGNHVVVRSKRLYILN